MSAPTIRELLHEAGRSPDELLDHRPGPRASNGIWADATFGRALERPARLDVRIVVYGAEARLTGPVCGGNCARRRGHEGPHRTAEEEEALRRAMFEARRRSSPRGAAMTLDGPPLDLTRAARALLDVLDHAQTFPYAGAHVKAIDTDGLAVATQHLRAAILNGRADDDALGEVLAAARRDANAQRAIGRHAQATALEGAISHITTHRVGVERADDLRALEDALILACIGYDLDLPGDYTIDDLQKRGLVYCERDSTGSHISGLTRAGAEWLAEQLGQLPARVLT